MARVVLPAALVLHVKMWEWAASLWAADIEGEEDWARAAQILGGINLDSGNRQLDDAYKLAKCVKIALLYLEDDDPVKFDFAIGVKMETVFQTGQVTVHYTVV